MSTRIYKYEVPIESMPQIEMPHHAKPLSIGFQDGILMLWAIVDPDKYPIVSRKFRLLMTGEILPDTKYIGEFIGAVSKNGIVMHLFDLENE